MKFLVAILSLSCLAARAAETPSAVRQLSPELADILEPQKTRSQIPPAQEHIPPVPIDPAQLETLAFAQGMIHYAFAKKFWTWSQYPGLAMRRENTSGLHLSQALNTYENRVGYQTWSASFFNDDAIGYVKAFLFPMSVFKQKTLATGHVVSFPPSSVICKVLFTENVKPGMHTIQASVAAATGGYVTVDGQLQSGMVVKTLGLLQMDISTKQYPNWTWATFSFQPNAAIKIPTTGLPGNPGTLSPHLSGGTYTQTDFSQNFKGPADNAKSTCMACHQLVQYPSLNLTEMIKQPNHHDAHPGPYPPSVWPDGTKKPGVKLDMMWEIAQALDQWDADEKAYRPHCLTATTDAR